ncbi:MAG: hypothetical protein Q7S63_03395 [bacterium]|nr:hypothetical protein [bacterium]
MPEEQQKEPQTNQAPQRNQQANAETQQGQSKGFGAILTPEGIIMLFIAGIIDVLSIIPGVNVVTDITGICVVGLWLLVRGKRPQQLGKGGKPMVRNFKWLGRIGTFLGEFIPGVSALPLWTMLVYFELKS